MKKKLIALLLLLTIVFIAVCFTLCNKDEAPEKDTPGETEGDTSGDGDGDGDGNSSGDGNTSGDTSGDGNTDTEGDTSGDNSGDTSVETPGDGSGDTSEDQPGDASGEGDGDNPGDNEGETPSDRFTETEWKEAFDLFNTIDKLGIAVSYSYSTEFPGAPLTTTMKWDGNKMYQNETYSMEMLNTECYYVFNDDSLGITTYSKNGSAWEASNAAYGSVEEYNTEKLLKSADGYLGFSHEYYRLTADGEDMLFSDLFDSFTYNEDTNEYTAKLYVQGMDLETGEPVYSETEWSLMFENGKLTQMVNIYDMDMFVITTNMTFVYDASITLPQ